MTDMVIEERVNISELSRQIGVMPSFLVQLIRNKRIPEAVRDEDGRYRIPNRRCVIPSAHPRKQGKINPFYFKQGEIPEEWITNYDSRPGYFDEGGDFVGVILEGDESEPLSSRIERTFGVEVAHVEEEIFEEEEEIEEENHTGEEDSTEEKGSTNGKATDTIVGIIDRREDTEDNNLEALCIDTERLRDLGIDLDALNVKEIVIKFR